MIPEHLFGGAICMKDNLKTKTTIRKLKRPQNRSTGCKLASVMGVFFLALFILGYTFAQHSAAADSQAQLTYVVQPGDSLWSIARQHSTPRQDVRLVVYQLQQINKLVSPIIQPGQCLVIPTP